jgi:N-acetylmuramoyl-L-alanine amidase
MSKVVILDAGHGGELNGVYQTSGKRSPVWEDGTQYFEGVGNRQIVHAASQYLERLGWTVLYTVHPSDPSDVTLSQRIKISNSHFQRYPEAFQISVHSNGFSKESANGYEVFTSKGQTKSDRIANIWIDEQGKAFPDLNNRGHKEANFAMNRVHCPSILIESMFHTNKKECEILMLESGREKIAIAIVETCERVHKEL